MTKSQKLIIPRSKGTAKTFGPADACFARWPQEKPVSGIMNLQAVWPAIQYELRRSDFHDANLSRDRTKVNAAPCGKQKGAEWQMAEKPRTRTRTRRIGGASGNNTQLNFWAK